MNILIINYFYPPIADAHAFRWEQISKHWASQGHHVEVITGRVRNLEKTQVEHGVHVTRVGWLQKPDPHTSKISSTSIQPSRPGWLKLSLMSVYRRLYWPDSAWHWIPGVCLEVLRRRRSHFDLVISYYPCFGAHIAGAILKRMAKPPGFVWMIDYGDPFSVSTAMYPNNYPLFRRLNVAAERFIVNHADQVILTNDETARTYTTTFSKPRVTHVLPHLVDVENLYSNNEAPCADNRKNVVLTYVGGFHRAVRRPDRLFDLIRKLNSLDAGNITLLIYGPLNGFAPEELAPPDCAQIIYKGPVARTQALRLIRDAEFLVNVDNNDCIMTPSKIVEYIGTGNKILSVSNSEAAYEPLERYVGQGFAVSLKSPTISDADVNAAWAFLYSTHLTSKASRAIVEDILAAHTLEEVAGAYLNLARRLRPNHSNDTA